MINSVKKTDEMGDDQQREKKKLKCDKEIIFPTFINNSYWIII